MTSQRRHDLLAVALLLLLPTLLFADVLFGSKSFYLGDIARFQYPMKKILHGIVSGGEFPYWNRLLEAGQPLAANPQYQVFYPPNWLIFLTAFELGFRLQILFHIYLAALGMYALLRSMRMAAVAALFGAISFSLGGAFLSFGSHLPFFYGAAWIPLTLLFARKFLIDRRGRQFAWASLLLALQILAGDPATVVQTVVALVLYAIYRGWQSERRLAAAAKGLFAVLMIFVAALAVAAVQIVPMLDLARDSVQRYGVPYSSVWSMPPARIAELVFPNLLGHISIGGLPWYWAARLYPGTGIPFVLNIYCGLALAALAAGGLAARIRGSLPFVVLFMASIALALGGRTPLLHHLYDLGMGTTIQAPEKFIFLAVFSMIVFSAHALDRALAGEHRVAEAAAGFAFAAGLVAGAVSILGYVPTSVDGFLSAFGLQASPGTLLMTARAWSDWSLAGARALLLLLILLTMYTRRRLAWALAALLFLSADLAGVVDELNPRIDRTFFTGVPELASVLPADHQDYRIYPQAGGNTVSPAAREFFRSGRQSVWAARNGLFPPINGAYGIASVMDRDHGRTALLPSAEFVRAAGEISRQSTADWWSPLMAMSNAWYRTVYADYDEEEQSAGGDVTKLVPVAFVEEDHHPRYYFADQIISVAGRGEFVRHMVSGSFGRNVAFINRASFDAARGVVDHVRETANRALIDVTASGRGFLVMSVTPHKYWRITVDGKPVPAIQTNIGYQGIIVPAGHHRVIMDYRNTLIPICGVISGIAILVLFGAALKWRHA